MFCSNKCQYAYKSGSKIFYFEGVTLFLSPYIYLSNMLFSDQGFCIHKKMGLSGTNFLEGETIWLHWKIGAALLRVCTRKVIPVAVK